MKRALTSTAIGALMLLPVILAFVFMPPMWLLAIIFVTLGVGLCFFTGKLFTIARKEKQRRLEYAAEANARRDEQLARYEKSYSEKPS